MVYFYDIESLVNVFSLCNYKPEENHTDVYLLCDDMYLMNVPNFETQLLDRIHEKNKNFNGTITLYNLQEREANEHLAATFGLSDAYMINDPNAKSSYPDKFRITCDTDPDYDENKHPFLGGYNSNNYDTTMLAIYFADVWEIVSPTLNNGLVRPVLRFMPAKASHLRKCNDDLFSSQFKNSMPSYLTMSVNPNTNQMEGPNYQDARWKIRKNMLLSGRHIDIARLNEKQSKVGLKRMIGMMGGQILESDKLKQGADCIENTDQLLDLIAYNVSDCVNLKVYLFDNKVYQSSFILKKQLLQTYPELIYDKKPNEYKPDIRPEHVRRDRLTIDSSSAQFSTKSLCPYGHLSDIPCVSFMYPSERNAKKLGVPRINVLEESKKFFYKLFPQPELRAQFDVIYNYYKSIEGKNFNESDNYKNDYNINEHPLHKLSEFDIENTTLPYFTADGKPSTCFVIFSTGGIHGAEFNKARFDHDMAEYQKKIDLLNIVKTMYPNPVDLKRAKHVVINGEKIAATKFLKTGATLSHAEYKDFTKDKPQLFKLVKNSVKLNDKYTYTSADPTTHEDFTSYYPNMLRMLSAFFNEGLGYDRYAEVFDNKQNYGFLMKEKNQNLTSEQAKEYAHLREATGLEIEPLHISDQERALYSTLREGTKLILNSASGAGDANFDSNIRMNNMIISMRIIGQLFSWRIGQAQTYHGAKITSTNTDGLYSVLESELNNKILNEESANIGVAIEPEPVFLISKDSNNRIEVDAQTGDIISASGGSLACRKGPDPRKSLAHPAILDWALTEYLIYASFPNKAGVTLSSEFDTIAGRNILLHAKDEFEPRKYLQMMQNVIASSPSSINYIFGMHENDNTPVILQHYNRAFIMKDKTENTMHLYAANAKKLTPATMQKRKREGLRPQIHDPVAVRVLAANGVVSTRLPTDKEATVKKITNISSEWSMRIDNRALCDIPDNEVTEIIDNLDIDKYLELFQNSFEDNWRNHLS